MSCAVGSVPQNPKVQKIDNLKLGEKMAVGVKTDAPCEQKNSFTINHCPVAMLYFSGDSSIHDIFTVRQGEKLLYFISTSNVTKYEMRREKLNNDIQPVR